MSTSHLDIHGLASVRVETGTRHLLAAVNNPLGYFCRSEPQDSAAAQSADAPIKLGVEIGPFDFDTDRCQPVDHKYFIRENHIAFRESLGGHRYSSLVELGEDETSIRFAHHGQNFRRFPRMFYADLSAWLYVIQPMLRVRLARLGWYLLHGAAMERDGQAVLFAGRGGIHKTSIALALARRGWRFMGDDMVLAGPGGQLACWPLFAERFAYLFEHCPDERMSLWRNLGSLGKLRQIGGYVPTADRAMLERVCVLQCGPGQRDITPLRWSREHLIRSVAISTEMEHIAGPDYKQIIGRFLEAYRFAFPMTELLDPWSKLETALTQSWLGLAVDGYTVPKDFTADGWLAALGLD